MACANLANLLLARASAREREIAVRLAIGASRGRVLRQLLAESLLLAALGAAAGIWLAGLLSRALVALLASDGTPLVLDLPTDWRMFAFAAGLAILTTLFFGVAPALRATRAEPQAVMRAGGRGLTASRERFTLRRGLVAGQMAVSVVLIVGALLFARSFTQLGAVDPGFEARPVLRVDLDFRPAGSPRAAGSPTRTRRSPALGRAGRRLGVHRRSRAVQRQRLEPDGDRRWREAGHLRQPQPRESALLRDAADAAPRGTGLHGPRHARVAHRGDRQPPIRRAVLGLEAGAAPDAVIGRRFHLDAGPGQPDPAYTIVGVVANTRHNSLREKLGPLAFFAAAQDPDPLPFSTVLLRANGEPDALRGSVTRALADLDPSILITFTAMETQIENTLLRERLMATLSGGFAVLAMLLATVGL
ncbi:MAG: FtsX-like permease family protein [Vicinamibacterales bacterium]